MPDGSTALRGDVVDEALGGLLAPRKTLPPKLFYDAEGCRLFGLITELPEYYLTRVELALLRQIGHDLGRKIPEGVAVVEYGAGSETKAAILLSSLRDPAAYVPIDVAEPELIEGAARLAQAFPTVAVYPISADFLGRVTLPTCIERVPRLGFFPGSTIGNLEPAVAVRFLRQVLAVLGRGAQLLLGADLRKDAGVLLPAYDDPQGITASFNLNVLSRLNREAGADFDLSAFEHRAVWNEAESRIEMHLVSRRPQTVHLAGRSIRFAAGETIHTENSYKYTRADLRRLAALSGWTLAQLWTDSAGLFSILLLEAMEQ